MSQKSNLLSTVQTIFSLNSSNRSWRSCIEKFAEQIISRSKQLSWFGYLSTTSVYGNHDGNWVDEKTPVNPSNNRGRLRLEAENRWASIDNLPIHIFRLAGIYGVNRNPLDKIRSGKAQLISNQDNF